MEQQEIFIQMALKAWNAQINRADKFFETLSDDSLLKEVAPGKNRIIYLIGHIIAVNDTMISLFGGKRLYTHLDEAFVKTPDKSGQNFPEPATLRKDWKEANEALAAYFAQMSAQDWFSKHTAMTEADLINEPGRNKLSVLINRTNHTAYHLGQLALAR